MVQGEKAILVRHCAVSGVIKRAVREWRASEAKPYAQYPCSVAVTYVEPRKRRPWHQRVFPDDLMFITIESKTGAVLYDSRADVPCDMDKWSATAERFAGMGSTL